MLWTVLIAACVADDAPGYELLQQINAMFDVVSDAYKSAHDLHKQTELLAQTIKDENVGWTRVSKQAAYVRNMHESGQRILQLTYQRQADLRTLPFEISDWYKDDFNRFSDDWEPLDIGGDCEWMLGVADSGGDDMKFAIISNNSASTLSLLRYRQTDYPVGVLQALVPKGKPCERSAGTGLMFDFHDHPPSVPFYLLGLTPPCQEKPGHLVLEQALLDAQGGLSFNELLRMKTGVESRMLRLRFLAGGRAQVAVGAKKLATWPLQLSSGRVGLFRRGAAEAVRVLEHVAIKPLSLMEALETESAGTPEMLMEYRTANEAEMESLRASMNLALDKERAAGNMRSAYFSKAHNPECFTVRPQVLSGDVFVNLFKSGWGLDSRNRVQRLKEESQPWLMLRHFGCPVGHFETVLLLLEGSEGGIFLRAPNDFHKHGTGPMIRVLLDSDTHIMRVQKIRESGAVTVAEATSQNISPYTFIQLTVDTSYSADKSSLMLDVSLGDTHLKTAEIQEPDLVARGLSNSAAGLWTSKGQVAFIQLDFEPSRRA
ncbi:MAG: hypothetical protein KVP17_001787 [Porospora cf. gigantea B]|uniref:uncharacterized protein n=1 Tax=Porospora cf. gigantea B TaxID=2853592 RepID=UPI003571DF7E|nr:MAG: hypothetical protein KVP17_001787 [Porospora cf. gigantea B]